MKKTVSIISGVLVVCVFIGWLIGSSNPETPAGYVGYLTQSALFGQTKFYGMQTGPVSPGRTWMLSVKNVSITPNAEKEIFTEGTSVLSKDNLKLGFSVHMVWKVREENVKNFIEKYSTLEKDDTSNSIIEVAYNNFLKEQLRSYARDEVQRLDGMEIKDNISQIGEALSKKVKALTEGSPFEISNIVVGNIQYPVEVADAVSKKLATTQLLEQKKIEVDIARADKEKRIVEAEGIAQAMEIVQTNLTPQYLQHEAIEAQKLMVGSPNHTTIYIPVGAMGVPIVGTIDTLANKSK